MPLKYKELARADTSPTTPPPQDNNTDFSDETNLQLVRGLDHTSAQTNDTITFICVDGTKWVEQGRSDNT